MVRDSMLEEARHICVACAAIKAAMAMYRRYYLENRRHKRELASRLNDILRQIFGLQQPSASTEEKYTTTDDAYSAVEKPRGLLFQARTLIKRTLGTAESKWKTESTPDRSMVDKPSLAIYYLSPFQVYLSENPVKRWSNNKGKLIFKYLGTRKGQPVAKEILMELFWPNAEPQAARNNLNVAIYGLRHVLSKANPDYSYVLYRDGCYLINPELHVWTDYQAFLEHFKSAQRFELRGEQDAAIKAYQMAESLYQQDFLEEDRYEEWSESIRIELRNKFLILLERLSRFYFKQGDYELCMAACGTALVADSCNEDFHRLLMRCYSRQGHTHLALR